jgi:tetratricopeptide (TPR) repeat protein
VALLFLALSPAAALARLDSPTTDRAEAHAKAAVANAHSPRALSSLIRLHSLRDEVDDLNILAQTYATVSARRSSEPLVRTLAVQLYADLERARGHLNKSAAMLEPLGFVQRYWVVGAFDNEGKGGCNTDFGPEGPSLSLDAVYPAKAKEVGWRKLEAQALDGFTDLSTLVRPNTDAVAYALGFLETTEEGRANLSIGASGAFRVWVNGSLAASEDRYNLPRPDQARVSVKLRKGVNRVLVKVCQENGPLGFYLRAERGDGSNVTPKATLPDALPALEKGPPPAPQGLPTATTLLEREVKKTPLDASLHGDFATVLSYYRAFDERQHSDVVEAEKAVELAPADAELQLIAAQLQHDDHNLRRKHLEAAVKADPSFPAALRSLAQHELTVEHPERALPALEALCEKYPLYASARLARSRAYEALGEWPRAALLSEAAFRDLPHLPEVVREAARVSRRLDRHQEATERLRTAIGLRFDDTNSRKALATDLADLGRPDDAASQLSQVLVLDPFDNASRLRLADLLAANARLDEAMAAFAEAKKLSPEEPEVYEREGKALLQAGRRDEAVASLQRALALRPQNPGLREVLRSLQGDDGTAGTQFALDPKELVKEADAFAGEDAVTLVDTTYVKVQPSGQSSRFQQVAVKLYTQRGVDQYRSMPISYSPNRQEVRVLKARITKPDGAVVDSYGESDRALNEPWSGMYYDTRAKMLSFPALSPGDLLEVQYRLDDSALENLLSDYWGDVDYVQATTPKVRYQYLVEMPAARTLYWNRAQLPPGIATSKDPEKDGRVLYRFTAKSLAKVIPEPAMPGWAEVVTTLHVSTYQSWDQVGRYWWGLVRDQLTPNDELKKTVEKLLVGVDRKDELAVVRAVYSFVVTNTRYVALEFGIHGFKPYRVDRILARRFGDCKDKASLIVAMLKVAGVDSRLVLLRMRHLGALAEEPASLAAFNHAIAYVPKYQLFLDGTAEFHGARELPSADRVANVLVVEPDGGSKFFTTPEATAQDNLTALSMNVALARDGSAGVTGESTISGQGAPDYRRAYQAQATRKQTFEQGWAQTFPGLTVQAMSIGDVTKLDQDVKLTFQLAVPRYAEQLPGGLKFYPFGGGRAYTQAYAPLAERKFDLVMASPWANTFHFRYALPPGYTANDLPAPVLDESPFGRLKLSYQVTDGKLVAEGEVTFTVARVKAADYAAFRAWLGRVDQAISRKLLVSAPVGQTAKR